MRYSAPPSLLAQPGRSQNWAMDTRRHAFNLLGRKQGVELSETARKREGLYRVLDAITRERQLKQQQEAMAPEDPGFFGGGGGGAVGSLAGLGVGALLALPPGGVSVPVGAALGGAIGGAAGGVADVAMAPGTRGAAAGAQQTANLPSSLMAYDQYTQQQPIQDARLGLIKAQTEYYKGRGSGADWTPEEIQGMKRSLLEKYGGGGRATEQQGQTLPTNPIFTGPPAPGPSPHATGPMPYRDYNYARFGM